MKAKESSKGKKTTWWSIVGEGVEAFSSARGKCGERGAGALGVRESYFVKALRDQTCVIEVIFCLCPTGFDSRRVRQSRKEVLV